MWKVHRLLIMSSNTKEHFHQGLLQMIGFEMIVVPLLVIHLAKIIMKLMRIYVLDVPHGVIVFYLVIHSKIMLIQRFTSFKRSVLFVRIGSF